MEIFLLMAVGAAAKYTTDSVRGWLAGRDQKAKDDMAAHEATVQEIAAGNYLGGPGKKGATDQKSTGNTSAGDKGKQQNSAASHASGPAPKSDGKKEQKGDAKAARKAAREDAKARSKAAREDARARSGAGRTGPSGRGGSGGPGRAPVGADSKGPGKVGPGKGGPAKGPAGAGASGKDGKGAAGSGGGKGAAGGSGTGTGGKDTAAKDKAARAAEKKTGKDTAAKDKAARKELLRNAGTHAGRTTRTALDARRDRADRKKAKKDKAAKDRAARQAEKDAAAKDPVGPGGTFAGDKAKRAGTRAGHRAGRAIQSARAYGTGFLEGFKDALAQADREAAAARAQEALDETRKPMIHTEPITSAPHPIRIRPVPVTGEDAKTGVLTLGTGAARKTISRGEVRTLKNFTDRLAEYASTATSAADDCKALSGEAQDYAAQATALAEQCRAVKGGEGLVGECLRLSEAATVQGGAADELHARMLRAVESLEATAANAVTRHGGIFQAVADSPLSSPAESRFYNS